VTGIEGIIRALIPFWETADPFILPEGVEAVSPPRQDFMGIALMAHIPYHLVLGEVKDMVKSHR
jgi:hypothetical protein